MSKMNDISKKIKDNFAQDAFPSSRWSTLDFIFSRFYVKNNTNETLEKIIFYREDEKDTVYEIEKIKPSEQPFASVKGYLAKARIEGNEHLKKHTVFMQYVTNEKVFTYKVGEYGTNDEVSMQTVSVLIDVKEVNDKEGLVFSVNNNYVA